MLDTSCAACLLTTGERNAAITVYNGAAVCRRHLIAAGGPYADEIAAAEARARVDRALRRRWENVVEDGGA